MRAAAAECRHRLAARWKEARARWPAAASDWRRQWLPALRNAPVSQWLAGCRHTAAAQWAWTRRLALAELLLYLAAYLAYVFSRGLVYGNAREVGIINGGRIADWQRELGFLWEPGWQAWALEHAQGIVVFLNWAYIVTYWPVILGLALFLFLRRRAKYYFYRTVVFLNLMAALLIFMLFPVASPFAIPGAGLEDTIQLLGPALYGSEEMAVFYNTSAAMPSLHFSWTVILGVYLWRSLPGGFKAMGVLYPAMTFFAITVTGNHFMLDALVGGVLVGLCFGAAAGWQLLAGRVKAAHFPAARAAVLQRMRQMQALTARRIGRPAP